MAARTAGAFSSAEICPASGMTRCSPLGIFAAASASACGGGTLVPGSAQEQGGCGDAMQIGSVGQGLQGFAAPFVADRIGGADHGANAVENRRVLGQGLRGEPAFDGRFNHVFHAAVARLVDARLEVGSVIGRGVGARVAGDQRGHAVGVMNGDAVADHSADGQADPVAPVDAEMIPDAKNVVDQHREGVGAGNGLALAVAALVVAQDPEARRQRRRDFVPQGEVVGQGVRKRDPGRAFGSFHDAVEGYSVRADLHDCLAGDVTLRPTCLRRRRSVLRKSSVRRARSPLPTPRTAWNGERCRGG